MKRINVHIKGKDQCHSNKSCSLNEEGERWGQSGEIRVWAVYTR